jgi:CubicO group peptidase (beta-lactamase class C family)
VTKRYFLNALSVFLLQAMIIASWPARAQEKKYDFSELEKTAIEELADTNTPGSAVAVVSGDQVIAAYGFGVSNIETGTPVTPDMLFRIGSTTKMYTTYALAALAEEGKIKLDAPVGNYVKGLSPRLSQVTAHQLMTHTAGIRDAAPSYGRHDESALAETVRSWTDDYLYNEPGKMMSYSNPGITLAGLVVEEVGGKRYADQISERLFKPLGMKSTTFRPTEAMTRPLAQGHNSSSKAKPVIARPFADNAGYWPAGFMFSNVYDLARFAIAFMNGGKIDGQQALSPSVLAKIGTPYTEAYSMGEGAKYGYGLMMSDFRGVRTVEHGGAIAGFGCLFRMVPEHRFAVICLANSSGVSLRKTAEKAMEIVLPLGPKAGEEAKELPMSEAEMKNYVGRYVLPPQYAEIYIKDGKLFGKIQGAEVPLKRTGKNLFSATPPNSSQPLRFVAVLGPDGKAEYLHMGLRALKRRADQQ